jgi:NADH:ubiquinone oxidoreductase subunit
MISFIPPRMDRSPSWQADWRFSTQLRKAKQTRNRQAMGIFKNIFTWWEGATFGTWLGTRMAGRHVGEDADGNVYYESTKPNGTALPRRWVIYKGSNDASRVPPEWHGWLHCTVDLPPTDILPPPRAWEKPGGVNPTGSPAAYRPAGALEAGGRRAAATGDYKAWSPDAA